jgi:membrane protein oxaA
MAFLSSILSAAGTVINEPSWLWEKIILHVFDFIANYGWRVVVFTLCLKLLLSPLDIYQRYKARKNQRITEKLKPQMEKLQKQYPDKTIFAQKQMQLQKQAGFSYFSSCLPSIVTMAVMFSLLGALNEVSQYMNFREYYEMYNEYNAAVVEYTDFDDAAVAALKEQGVISDERKDASGATVSYEIQYAQKAVYDFYQENKTSFLWINNIWSPDVPWKKEVNDFKQFTANIGKYGTDAKKSGLSDTELADMKTKYNTVMGLLLDEENNGANGYLVLPILSVLLSVGMQLITMRQQKKSGQMNDAMGGGGAMKVMMFVMPVMIGFFSLSYTSAFSLYLVVNYVFSLIINVGSNIILYGIDRHEKKKLETEVHKYGRPDPNDFNK